MNEKDTTKSIIIVITAILIGGFFLLADIDVFFEFPAILVLWLAVGYGVTAMAHLISLIVYLLTKKGFLNILLLLCPGILTLISILWAIHESHSFLGNIGAGVITALFTIPFVCTFLFQLIAAVLRMRKKYRRMQLQQKDTE